MNLFVLQLEQHHDTIFQRKYSPALPERGTSSTEALPRRGVPGSVVPGSVVPTGAGKDAAAGSVRAGNLQPPVQRFDAASAPLTWREMRSRRWQKGGAVQGPPLG